GLSGGARPPPRALRTPPAADARLAGLDDCLGPIDDLDLREDARDVVANRLDREVELRGDLLIRPSAGSQLQDLALARGEIGKPSHRCGGCRDLEEPDHAT